MWDKLITVFYRISGTKRRINNAINVLDFGSAELHPIAASYKAGVNPFLISVNPLDMRGWFGIPFSDHPFVKTVNQLIENPSLKYEHSSLSVFHNNFQPKDAAERCGLQSSRSILRTYPPYCAVLPWFRSSLEQRKVRFEQNYKYQNIGRGKDLPIEAGFGGFGPASYAKGVLEVETLQRILHSIQTTGYNPTPTRDGHITAYMLVREDQAIRFLVRSGHHRASVLFALGYPRVPTQISCANIVRRADAAHWPMVLGGAFSVSEGLQIFDNIFEGNYLSWDKP